jgi:putative transposase
MFGVIRRDIGEIMKKLCRRFEVKLVEGHVMSDHVRMCLGIPPKYSVSHTIGKLKGKSTILLHQRYGCKRNYIGLKFWSRRYCVSTVGLDEAVIRNYIRTQEEREKREDQVDLDCWYGKYGRFTALNRGLSLTTRYAGST